MTKPTSWYAERYSNKYHFALIPLKPASKLPLMDDWGNNTLNGNAPAYFEANPNHNIGLELHQSRMCSLDIDCMESFKVILDEFGIDESELDNYPTVQGSSKGSRILFRVPDDQQLAYHKVNWPRKDDPKKHYTVFELRAGAEGKQRFDVLPPSIHPDTQQPYKWVTQPPKQGDWPTPPAWLTAIWTAWEAFGPQLKDACPWYDAPKPEPSKPRPAPTDAGDKLTEVVEGYKRANPLRSQLDRYGYTCKGKRYLSPHTTSNIAGVHMLDDDTCWIHHASDPLCSEDGGHPVNSFDLFCYYDHGNDRSKAFKAAAEELGISLKRERKEAPAPEVKQQTEASAPEPTPAPAEPEQQAVQFDFITLGFNDGYGYFLPKRTEQVTRFSLGSLRKQNLLQLSSLAWWESMYPTKN